MANEFIIRKGYKSLAASEVTGSLKTTGDITVGPKSNASVQVSESGGSTVKLLAGSVGRIGTYSDHDLKLVTNSNDRLTISNSGDAIFTSNVTAQGYLQSYGVLYLRNKIQLLNKAGSGWLDFASRNTTASEAVYDLTNIGTVTAATTFISKDVDTGNPQPNTDELRVSGYGIIGKRGTVYVTNANSSGTVQIGVGGAHNAGPKLIVGTTNSTFYTSLLPDTDSTYNIGSTSLRFANIYTDAISVLGQGTFDTINTGQGATEVHLMNQNLRTTDNVTFPKITVAQGTTYANGYRLTRTGHDTYRIGLGNSEGLRIINESDSAREELAFDGAGNAAFSGATTSTKVNINQAADEQGLEIKGYDDHSSSDIKLQINSSGHARLSQTTDGSSGYLFLQAENYLQLIAGSFVYTTSTFRVYDNTQLQFGNSGDYKIYHSTSADTLYIHTDDNKGITIDNAGNTTFTEDVVVQGTLTAQEFKTELVSASIVFESGSTIFGNSNDDTHDFTGTLNVTSSAANTILTIGNSGTGGVNWGIYSANSSSPQAASSGDLLFRNASSNVFILQNNLQANFYGNVNLLDNKMLMWGGNSILKHTGTATEIGDNSSSSTISISGGATTFANDINLSAGQVKLRGDDALDHDGSSLYIKAPSAIYFYPGNANKGNISTGGTLTLSGGVSASGNISTAGTITGKSSLFIRDTDSNSNHIQARSNGTEGFLTVSNGSNWGFIVRGPGNDPRIGAYHGGTLKIEGFHSSDGATGTNAIDFAQFQFGNNHFLVNAASNRFTGFVGIKTPSSYTANTNADDLIVGSGTGNQGITIYSGDSSSGAIYFADDLDEEGAGDSPAGNRDGVILYSHGNSRFDFKTGGNQQALRLTNSSATLTGDLTVSGGDITLGGTGRIQGIDTVSAATDAANKAYVDANAGGISNVVEDTTPQLGGNLDTNGKEINEGGSTTFSIDLKDHNNYTWLRNETGIWTFQAGTAGDDWTRSFQFKVNSTDSDGDNENWMELGQRVSNDTHGEHRGVRIRKFESSAVVDGDFQAGRAFFGHVTPSSDGAYSLGLGSGTNLRWSGLELSNSAAIQWQNGDARIIEGDGDNYSLSLQTYDGSALSTGLKVYGNNQVYIKGKLGINTTNPDGQGYSFAEDLVILGGNSASDGVGITLRGNGKRYGVIAFGDNADDNSGEIWYDHTENSLNFRANANREMVVNDSGVGIDNKLVINSVAPQSYTHDLTIAGSGGLQQSIAIGNYSVTKDTRQYIGYTRADTGLFETNSSGNSISGVLAGVAGIRICNVEGSILSSQADQHVQLLTHIYNGGSRVALHAHADGKVGIGTTSPSATLHIADAATSAVTSLSANGRITLSGDGVIKWGASANYGVLTWDTSKAIIASQGSNRLHLATPGNADQVVLSGDHVGVGLSNPAHLLHVQGDDTDGVLVISRTSNTDQKLFLRSGAGSGEARVASQYHLELKSGLGGSNAYDLSLSTSAGVALRIDGTNQYVGIGTTGPGAKLEVGGANAAIWINPADGAHAGLHFRQADTFRGFVGYNDSANVVNLSMDGSITNGLNVNSSHNVGIGTTTPAEKLEVNGSIKLGSMKLQNVSAGGRIGFNRNTSNGAIYDSSYEAFQVQSNGSGYLETQAYNSSGAYQGSLYFTTAGNLGIGNSSTAAKLDVEAGALGSTSGNSTTAAIFRAGRQNLIFRDTRTANGSDWNNATFKIIAAIDSTNHQSIDFVNDSGFLEHIDIRTGNQVFHSRFTSTGRLGIGTTSPGGALHVYNGGSERFLVDGDVKVAGSTDLMITGASRRLSFTSGTGTIRTTTGNNLYLQANSTTVLELKSNSVAEFTGNVGIGTGSPGANLEIFGTGNTLRLDSAANQSKTILFRNVGSGTAEIKTDGDLKLNAEDSGKTIQFFTANTEKVRIDSSGNVGIGATSPTYKLQVQGTGYFNSTLYVNGTTTINDDLIIDHNIIGNSKNFATANAWASGSGTQTGYYGGNFGGDSQGIVKYDVGPFGSRELIQETVPDSANDYDGGWNKTITELDINKVHMSVVYVRRITSQANGSFYHGTGTSTGQIQNLNGTNNTNPYFQSTAVSNLPQNVWCVSIGFIQANNDTNTDTGTQYNSRSGIYRLDTGQKINNGSVYKFGPNGSTLSSGHRTFMYYSTDNATKLQFARPGFYEMNGDAPTFESLVGKPVAISINQSGNPTLAANVTAAEIRSLIGAGTGTLSTESDTLATVTGRGASTSTSSTFSGGLVASGGISGLTLTNGISGTNFNISGVNQLSIADPGEGIVFGGGSSGNIVLAVTDDSSDNVLELSGTNRQFKLGEAVLGEHAVHSGYFGLWNTEAIVSTTQQYMIISSGTDTYINGDTVIIRGGNNSSTNQLIVNTTGTTIGGNTVWHAGNDGPTSGLSAQYVGSLEGNQFLRSDAADTSTGEILFDAGFKSDSILLTGAQNFDNISRSGFYNLYNTATNSTNSPPFTYGTMIVVGGNKQNNSFGLQIAHERTGTGLYVRGMNDSSSTWYDWDEIWTSGTDGAGSGLDADLLDAMQPKSATGAAGSNQILRTHSNGYLYMQNWIDVGTAGLFSTTTNGAHLRPNASSDYGTWRVDGTRGGYNGLVFGFDGNSPANGLIATSTQIGLYNDTNNEWLLQGNHNGTLKLYYNGSQKFSTTSAGVDVTGNVTHDGLTMTSGTDVDQLTTVNMTYTLSANTWTDTGINSSELATGTYAIQLFVDDHSAGGGHYDVVYSGMMSWYGSNTNSSNHDEIVLHRVGHATNNSIIQLRTQMHSGGGDNVMLQIKQNFAHTAAMSGTTDGRRHNFKFRRLI